MRYNNIDSKDLYHNGVYPKLPLRIDVNIANYCRYFDNNFIDISRNIHCVLNDINKIIVSK